MSLQIYSRLLPQILKNVQKKQIIFTNYKAIPVCLCKFQSTQTNQTNSNEILVYTGILTTQLRAVKLFSLLTSLTGIMAQPVLYSQLMSLGNVPLIVVAWSFFGFFTLGTPILLHMIAKKYVTQLRYKVDTDSYIATTVNLVNFKKDLEFKPDDVKVPEGLGMFTSFIAKGSPLFVEPRLFEDPKHYGKIMGYDKPIDMKLYQTSLNNKKNN
ncbi:hypothetical protein RN001_010151 [Aquatica leii]|uniref:Transmembrane protein 70 n=1 Tax=Aquatica leii TaxID=1421715 RepID=A0AAN7P0H8_9COLE|nr:hypothetical protein RN001_010151 [Aquatica leii]